MKILYLLTLLLAAEFAAAQVNEIKAARSSSSRLSENLSSVSSGGILADLLFNVVLGEVVRAQQERLKQIEEMPGMISLEAMVQVAAQPSSYYIIHPRVRANWGLFSTDFRFNYLVEENSGEMRHIRTDDWQIVQLNLVANPDMIFRIGGGIVHENYNEGDVHTELTAALQLHPRKWRVGTNGEYRIAEMREEISANLEYRLFEQRQLHGFATVGAVYQKYYSTVSAWGLQGGMLLKVY